MFSKCSPCSPRLAKWFPGEVKAHFLPRGSAGAEREILLPVPLCQPCDIKPHRCRTQLPVFTSTALHSRVAAEEFTDGWPGWQGAGEMTPLTPVQDKTGRADKARLREAGGRWEWLYLNTEARGAMKGKQIFQFCSNTVFWRFVVFLFFFLVTWCLLHDV